MKNLRVYKCLKTRIFLQVLMKKVTIIAISIVLILSGLILVVAFENGNNYIKIPQHTNSFTKAICDSRNLCQDYEVFCNNKEVVKISLITGAVMQFPEAWEDPRSEKIRNRNC